MNSNYPPGADGIDAPWRQPEPREKQIDVCVSICMSKTLPVYFETVDEDYCPDSEELKELVKKQLGLPKEFEDEEWYIDDFEVIPE